jgi:uncharacterized protein YerC
MPPRQIKQKLTALELVPQQEITMERTFYGPITATEYETAEARDFYERIASQRLANDVNDDPLSPNYVGPSADDIKRAHQVVEDAQRDKAKDMADERSAAVFVELNPWFVACPQNATQMEVYLNAKGLTDKTATVETLEEAAQYLASRGLLKVNNEAIANERRAEVKEQAEEIRTARRSSGLSRSGVSTRTISRAVRTRPVNEDDLYNMSLEELRARAVQEEM